MNFKVVVAQTGAGINVNDSKRSKSGQDLDEDAPTPPLKLRIIRDNSSSSGESHDQHQSNNTVGSIIKAPILMKNHTDATNAPNVMQIKEVSTNTRPTIPTNSIASDVSANLRISTKNEPMN